MAYDYQTKYNSPNFTPAAQVPAVWGVNRVIKNIAIHWWGDPATNPTFEGVVAHLDDPASGVSAHYVATGTGRQVACLVDPANASWSTMGDNPYCISIECDPRCRDEDYDVVAELVADIRSAYGASLPLVPHKQFTATTCPGNWDLGRIDRIASTKVSQAQWGQVTTNAPITTTTTTVAPTTTTTTTTIPVPAVEPTTEETATTTTSTTVAAEPITTTTTEVAIPAHPFPPINLPAVNVVVRKSGFWEKVGQILIAIFNRLRGIQ
jgi:cell division septation protein DedD